MHEVTGSDSTGSRNAFRPRSPQGRRPIVMQTETAQETDPSRSNLREEAYRGFMQALLDRSLRPGRLVSQREIAQIIDVSLSSVREALKRLEGEGIVELIPKRGVMIREVTRKEVADAYDLRILIELQAIGRFIADHDRAEVASIRARTEQLIAASPATREEEIALFDQRVHLDHLFHQRIVGALKNDLISSIQEKYETTMLLARLNLPLHFHSHGPAFYEHLTILDGIMRGDVDAAKRALKQHLISARERAVKSIDA